MDAGVPGFAQPVLDLVEGQHLSADPVPGLAERARHVGDLLAGIVEKRLDRDDVVGVDMERLLLFGRHLAGIGVAEVGQVRREPLAVLAGRPRVVEAAASGSRGEHGVESRRIGDAGSRAGREEEAKECRRAQSLHHRLPSRRGSRARSGSVT